MIADWNTIGYGRYCQPTTYCLVDSIVSMYFWLISSTTEKISENIIQNYSNTEDKGDDVYECFTIILNESIDGGTGFLKREYLYTKKVKTNIKNREH